MTRKLLLFHFVIGCAGAEPSPTPVTPFERPISELPSIIETQAYESRLSIDGLVFRDTALYVTTNVGLLEARGYVLTRLYQWHADDNVVSGPWHDPTHDRLWIQRAHDNVFLRRDSTGWVQVQLPRPPAGSDYTRGDILEGFRGVGDSTGFWLVGAGNVWRWSGDSAWSIEHRPPTDAFNGTIGFARLGDHEVTVVTSGGCGYLACTNQAYWSIGGEWQRPLRLPLKNVEDVQAASNAVFVRGGKGELLRIERDSAVTIPTPGPCEAITRTSDGKLLASFRGKGIFILEDTWRRLFDDPNGPPDGDQQAFLAEQRGLVAYATTTVPKLEEGSTHKFYQSGHLSLWRSDGSRLRAITLTR